MYVPPCVYVNVGFVKKLVVPGEQLPLAKSQSKHHSTLVASTVRLLKFTVIGAQLVVSGLSQVKLASIVFGYTMIGMVKEESPQSFQAWTVMLKVIATVVLFIKV